MTTVPKSRSTWGGAIASLVCLASASGCAEVESEWSAAGHHTLAQLSPPIVHDPIHECAESVLVEGIVKGAAVRVLANGSEPVGDAVSDFGSVDVELTRALELGEAVTAVQTKDGVTSAPSIDPVIVGEYPLVAGGFGKPDVGDHLWECGHVVPVGDLVESVRVALVA